MPFPASLRPLSNQNSTLISSSTLSGVALERGKERAWIIKEQRFAKASEGKPSFSKRPRYFGKRGSPDRGLDSWDSNAQNEGQPP